MSKRKKAKKNRPETGIGPEPYGRRLMRDVARLVAAAYVIAMLVGFLGLIRAREDSLRRESARTRVDVEREMVKAIRAAERLR